MIFVYEHETPLEIAHKMWHQFEVGQSITIYHFGEEVMERLKDIDIYENHYMRRGVPSRKFKYYKDAVGGPIAHKIFRYKRTMDEGVPRYQIWRVQ